MFNNNNMMKECKRDITLIQPIGKGIGVDRVVVFAESIDSGS